MNTSKKTIYAMLKSITCLSLAIFIMASCHKDNDNSTVAPNSKIMLVHASPGTTPYDVTMNGLRLNMNAITYGNYLNYGPVSSGNAEFSLLRWGTKTVVVKDSFSLKPYAAYSLFIADTSSNVGLLLIADDLSAPAKGKAKLRFINLNPDAASLNLNLLGDTTALFTKIPFKGNTAFIQVDPSTGIGFSLADSTGENILATSAKYKIDQGGIYTVIAKATKSATDTTTPAIGMINNR
jgi:hypothetical protein